MEADTEMHSMTTAFVDTANYQDGWRQRHATHARHPLRVCRSIESL